MQESNVFSGAVPSAPVGAPLLELLELEAGAATDDVAGGTCCGSGGPKATTL